MRRIWQARMEKAKSTRLAPSSVPTCGKAMPERKRSKAEKEARGGATIRKATGIRSHLANRTTTPVIAVIKALIRLGTGSPFVCWVNRLSYDI